MAPDNLKAARSRYMIAYDAYQHVSKRVAQKLASGLTPSAEEVEEEGKAIEQLAVARRHLLEAMASVAPARH
jgi:hypothetical protein